MAGTKEKIGEKMQVSKDKLRALKENMALHNPSVSEFKNDLRNAANKKAHARNKRKRRDR